MSSVNSSASDSREARLTSLLNAALSPESLDVINESHLHQGHAGSPGTGESHYKIIIKASDLEGINRVAAHRLVNQAVAAEFESGLHALGIKIIK